MSPVLLNPYAGGPITYAHANLQRRWDASVLSGFADGAAITSWPDVLGANTLSNSNVANRPIYKTGIRNGLAIARFDTTDWIEGFPVPATAMTIALTRELDTTAGTTVHAWNGRSTKGGGTIVSSGNRGAYVRAVAIDSDGAATTAWERWILCMGTGGAGSTRLYVNGTQVVSTTSAMVAVTSDGICVVRLGAADGATQASGTPAQLSGGMDVGEALFFDVSLNSTEVGVLDTYLASKW